MGVCRYMEAGGAEEEEEEEEEEEGVERGGWGHLQRVAG